MEKGFEQEQECLIAGKSSEHPDMGEADRNRETNAQDQVSDEDVSLPKGSEEHTAKEPHRMGGDSADRGMHEKEAKDVLLEIRSGENEKIVFSSFDSFDPAVAPSEDSHEIPELIRKYLMGEGKIDKSYFGSGTYQETIKSENWEQELFLFVSSYLGGDGASVLEEFSIDDLNDLTPKQAAELALRVVMDLTKYKWSDVPDMDDKNDSRLVRTEADTRTVQQLLQEGLDRKDDPDWEGNGICRNVACSVKAVFEALKAGQIASNRLRDTYCLYEVGKAEPTPGRENTNIFSMRLEEGHAWNTFVAISGNTADLAIVDATFSNTDSEQERYGENPDYTLIRMEPIVYAAAKDIPATAPDKEEQLRHLLSYYASAIGETDINRTKIPPVSKMAEGEKAYYKDIAFKKNGDKYGIKDLDEEDQIMIGAQFIEGVNQAQEREREERVAYRAIELMRCSGVPKELPATLAEKIGYVYRRMADDADPSEIETLFKVCRSEPEADFHTVLRRYLLSKPLANHNSDLFVFTDDDLQREVYEEIKSRDGFDKFIKGCTEYRLRMREVLPQLFIDFHPEEKPEDAAELKHMLMRNPQLHQEERMLGFIPAPKDVKRAIESVRNKLRGLNEQEYDASIAQMSDYDIVKRYGKLSQQLRGE
jgi:hypothetical protein